jgi:hypothetical protein
MFPYDLLAVFPRFVAWYKGGLGDVYLVVGMRLVRDNPTTI